MTLSESCFLLSARKMADFALILGCLIVGYAQGMSGQSGHSSRWRNRSGGVHGCFGLE